jgi:hypothetical protein
MPLLKSRPARNIMRAGVGLAQNALRGSNLGRAALPMLRSPRGQSVMRAGVGLARDALRGRNMSEALANRLEQGFGDVMGPRSYPRARRRRVSKRRVGRVPVRKRRRTQYGDIFG